MLQQRTTICSHIYQWIQQRIYQLIELHRTILKNKRNAIIIDIKTKFKEVISVLIKYALNFYLIQSLIWLHGLTQIVEWDEVTLFRSCNMYLQQQNGTWMLQYKLSNPSHHPEQLLCKIFSLRMIHFLNFFVVESCNHLKYTIHRQTNIHQSNPGNFKELKLCNFGFYTACGITSF